MNKFFSCRLTKAIAAIITAVSITVLIITGAMSVYIVDGGAGINSDLSFEYNSMAGMVTEESLVPYREMALEYYKCLLKGSSFADRYKEALSYEKCYYFFKIKPLYRNDYPDAENYYSNDYIYSGTTEEQISTVVEERDFYYQADKDEIFDKFLSNYYQDNERSFFQEFKILDNEQNREIAKKHMECYLSGTGLVIKIPFTKEYEAAWDEMDYDDSMLEMCCFADIDIYSLKGYEEFYSKSINEISEKYKDLPNKELELIEDEPEYREDGQIGLHIIVRDTFIVSITEYVKAEFIKDNLFMGTFWYNYMLDMRQWGIKPVIASGLLFITGTLMLLRCAGHKKGCGEAALGKARLIPFELPLAGTVFLCGWLLNFVHENIICGALDDWDWLSAAAVSALGLSTGFLYAYTVYTASYRTKNGIFLKNTIFYRLWRLLRKCVHYLSKNINIYWKAAGIYTIIIFIDIFALSLAGNMEEGAAAVIIILEKLMVMGFLIVFTVQFNSLKKAGHEMAGGNSGYLVNTRLMLSFLKEHGDNLNRINEGVQIAVEERIKSERMKTELITNVSHDIKTPLTSIISYVDLLKKEQIDNENAAAYVEVLDRQSQRLKKLIQDLIDVSKASTGNMPVNMEDININVFVGQILGEFAEKLENRSLKPIVKSDGENIMARADGRLLQRIFDNIMQNVYKYSKADTRVYIDIVSSGALVNVTVKNISSEELNISGEELMERFVRGDSSRNTDGSGLGLSIAQSLAQLLGGSLEITVDGDLFKAAVSLKKIEGIEGLIMEAQV